MALKVGDKVPNFKGRTTDGPVSLKDMKGQNIVLYFYPKDNTPGCTQESCDFRDKLPEFKKMNAVVYGVSKDSIESHHRFSQKYDLSFPLISDSDGNICDSFGTWVEKSMYGKKYMGIERSTFLIDKHGIIRQIWRKVKVDCHVNDVSDMIKKLK